MKSDPTNRSLRPFRPDVRRSDRKTPIRTERLSADFPAGGADTCESESRPTSGTIPIRRTDSADLFRTACALLFLLSLLSGCDDIFDDGKVITVLDITWLIFLVAPAVWGILHAAASHK